MMYHRPIFILWLLPFFLTSAAVAQESAPIRVNAGGNSFVDADGNQWNGDEYYTRGTTFTKASVQVNDTALQPLYQSERWSNSKLTYDIPISQPALYFVRIHFAEIRTYIRSAGDRLFSVKIDGTLVSEDLDIFLEAGGAYKPLVKTHLVNVTDSILSIELLPGPARNPKISGIEVLPTTDSIYINAGSDEPFTDSIGRTWEADEYFNVGLTTKTDHDIEGTTIDTLYQTERWNYDNDTALMYAIPVSAPAIFLLTLHFADIFSGTHSVGARVFDVKILDTTVSRNFDLYKEGGEQGYYAIIKSWLVQVDGDALTVEFLHVTENPTIAGLEVHRIVGLDPSALVSQTLPLQVDTSNPTLPTGPAPPQSTVPPPQAANESEVIAQPHYAHAVPGGPYFQVDTDSDGKATVLVDGYFSHTHLPDASLIRWTWMVNGTVVGENSYATAFELPVGFHNLTLEVEDTGGFIASDFTTVTVHPARFPDIRMIDPEMGSVAGGESLTIVGSGFNFSAADTIVHIGSTALTDGDITVIDNETIEVKSVPPSSVGLVDVSVQTPIGKSQSVSYSYIDEELPAINFTSGDVLSYLRSPTCLAFGPDGRLYIGTQQGEIARVALDENYQEVEKLVSPVIADSEDVRRVILGIAFDPSDQSDVPTVYVSHSWLFHGLDVSYNGKVSAVSGPNLAQMRHIVTGLPVSDHDHGINGIVFGDQGELYIQVPGNTNAGVRGALSSRNQQDEDALSASTVVARNIHSPDFDGAITYDEEGNQISGHDVMVFAPGQRNSYGIVLHSNGFLYATDNGPNGGFGDKSVSCTEEGDDPSERDELNLITEGNFYGHANRRRGQTDPRQCRWRSMDEPSDNEYTAPIAMLRSSSNGLCEFETEHFAGQLRGNLIIGRWNGEIYNVALTNTGLATETGPSAYPPVLLEEGALDIVQGPDGTLFTANHASRKVKFYSPMEAYSTDIKIKSVYPRRGPKNGGSTLTIYGDNFYTFGLPVVFIGQNPCEVHAPTSDSKIMCTIPQGEGMTNVIVTAGSRTNMLVGGYRYISAEPRPPTPPLPTMAPVPTIAPPTHPPTPVPAPNIPPSIATIDSLGVSDLVWVNSNTNADIGLVEAVCNECFDLAIPVNIRANTFGDVNSVTMTLDGPLTSQITKNVMLWALFGDVDHDYNGQIFEKGSYTITVQAFSSPGGTGVAGPLVSVDFEIV